MEASRVSGTVAASGRDMPVIPNKPRKRIRLLSVSNMRGPNAGAPGSEAFNTFPFPFQGMYQPARHGHHPVVPVGAVRRVGAWRLGGTGTMGGNSRRGKELS